MSATIAMEFSMNKNPWLFASLLDVLLGINFQNYSV